MADSLSRIFIVDENFEIELRHSNGKTVKITNERRYQQLDAEFEWGVHDLVTGGDTFSSKIDAKFITAKTPIAPSTGLRGITIFSRGKLVNAPDFFSNSTSSHFFQYLTGWVRADFIDLLDEDVISTNRQSINWDHPEMSEFKAYLSDLISKVGSSWREKRKAKKEQNFKNSTGINKEEWFSKLPIDIKDSVQKIVDTLSDDEGISSNFSPVIKALYEIVPEYPLLHWRHLHEKLRPRIEPYYINKQYGEAADQGAKIFSQVVRELTGGDVDGADVASVFASGNKKEKRPPILQVADIETESGWNIQEGQQHLTRGVMMGFRNPINHAPIDSVVPDTFSELDCLNILSLISYLFSRLDGAKHNGGKT